MWIKRQIIMLPSKNGNSKIGLNPSALFNKPHLYYFNGGAVYHECQHFFITSDEEIKEGDWIYHLSRKEVFRIHHFDSSNNNKTIVTSDKDFLELPNRFIEVLVSDCRKIIATTDTSLGLPQPSQQFIEKYIEEYNKGNQIEKVMVKYETSQITKQEWFQEAPYRVKYDITTLKVKSDNTITIRKIKDSWSREEVIKLCRSAYLHGEQGALNIHYQTFKQWIEENL